jgi:hypothetical protein
LSRAAVRTLIVALALWPALAQAQQAVTSPVPAHVSVTIYREPGRQPDAEFDRDWLRGYALVTETREVDLTAGPATVRFAGVAAGMLAETALVRGLPSGVAEQNLDADLIGARISMRAALAVRCCCAASIGAPALWSKSRASYAPAPMALP